MPKLKSSRKRLRQNLRARARNRASRSILRTTLKKVRSAPGKEEALSALPEAVSVLDRSVKKGILHRNTAARVKSKLVRQVNALLHTCN